jgi:hypothetical protein
MMGCVAAPDVDPEVAERVQAAWDGRRGWNEAAAMAAGRAVYEALPAGGRPAWAARLLRLCLTRLDDPPQAVLHVADLAKDERRWSEAHDAFQAVRQLTLRAERWPRRKPSKLILYVAENVAKIVYNASGSPAPFDHSAGWRLLGNVRDFLDTLDRDAAFEREVRRAVVGAP